MDNNRFDHIKIVNANENNLKNISLEIPKKKITVFTGVSGSGKSSICLDTIAAESRRELNKTFPSFIQQYLPKYGRPDVERIENLPVTILLDQKKPSSNSRSTVGTYTDIHSLLRLLFSRIGEPFAGYSDIFSFNHPSGQCKKCEGLGVTTELDIHKLVDFDKSLNDEGVINFPAFTTGAWRWKRYAYSGLFDLDKKIKDYSEKELNLFLHSPQTRLKNPPPNWPKSAKFEGIYPRMYRSIINQKEGKRHQKILETMITTAICPQCNGTRYNEKIRSCRIIGKNISDVASMSIPDAMDFISQISHHLAEDIKAEIIKRLQALKDIGLGYISLDRNIGTLSGGEAQRTKIAKYINSSLTDMVYVLDEPSAGLHPHDIDLLKNSLRMLKDRGNTILIVEHNRAIIELADHVIDMGPSGGSKGGEIMFSNTYEKLLDSDNLTGKLLREKTPLKKAFRNPKDWITIENANLHNLKNITIDLPLGVLTVIAGVAGSGKSSLMDHFENNCTEDIIAIHQKSIGINSRSTPATYLDISDNIRELFALENKVSKKLFSFNSEGACPACNGKGIIVSEMGFMDSIETLCDLCNGKRYAKEVLVYKYRNKDISEVMDMTVNNAVEFFGDNEFAEKLKSLQKTGLGYLHLNQSMSTLSGGELQRVKLASQLNRKGSIFIMDEPTDGLHLNDMKMLMDLFNHLVDQGNSLFIIEHSLDIMKGSDYIIELGPGGGTSGGNILFAGTPEKLLHSDASITRPFLEDSLPAQCKNTGP
ncbi:excinuclease ABC, A subunit [Dethiosulfatibacter aminovorans DSM 17477]|uniref:UvrABC system protein A n=1 Tax=Dethiosulfatibacter aminovorans DSM 17477 TaxID=1121476 RepID=A0A1M6H028_9FIRM|nr:excinuclease ABC subunit UvrA [Dethiosulfatibacter aminovorans]SHJ15513.1 excinuclease ABC, A subunit [Dethiosulfatibacter aminovorans DSM 17477]